MVEPDREERQDGIDGKKPDDANDLLLFHGSSPAGHVYVAQVYTDANCRESQYGCYDGHEQMKGDISPW